MATNAYIIIKGQKQGLIQGPVVQKGREGSIQVYSFTHEILSPRDLQSGLPTGKRQHQPLSIGKEVDKSSPLLWRALVSNENLSSVELQFWTAGGVTPAEKQTYTIKLTNANIVSINESLNAAAVPPLREEVTFSYQKIDWEWNDGGIQTEDDWEARV